MSARVCLWCDAPFTDCGRGVVFCSRPCGDAWRRVESRRKRLAREKVWRRLAAGARRYQATQRDLRRAA